MNGQYVAYTFYKVDPAQVFTKDGWYGTNDLVRMDEDGHLWFHARRGLARRFRARARRVVLEIRRYRGSRRR